MVSSSDPLVMVTHRGEDEINNGESETTIRGKIKDGKKNSKSKKLLRKDEPINWSVSEIGHIFGLIIDKSTNIFLVLHFYQICLCLRRREKVLKLTCH